MKKGLFFGSILSLISQGLMAQNAINTDMPDQSDGTHIVELHHIQFETGVQFSKPGDGSKGVDEVTLVRYGVTRKFEIRLLNQYSVVTGSNRISGTQPFTISFKNQLCNQYGLLPKLTLVSYFKLPFTISPGYPGDHFGYTFTLAARHELSSKLKLYTNFGITQDQQTTDISYLGAVELNYNITDKFSAYAEYYGNYARYVNAANGMDIGVIYAIKNNIAVDMAVGTPTLDPVLNRFLSLGVSVRLPD